MSTAVEDLVTRKVAENAAAAEAKRRRGLGLSPLAEKAPPPKAPRRTGGTTAGTPAGAPPAEPAAAAAAAAEVASATPPPVRPSMDDIRERRLQRSLTDEAQKRDLLRQAVIARQATEQAAGLPPERPVAKSLRSQYELLKTLGMEPEEYPELALARAKEAGRGTRVHRFGPYEEEVIAARRELPGVSREAALPGIGIRGFPGQRTEAELIAEEGVKPPVGEYERMRRLDLVGQMREAEEAARREVETIPRVPAAATSAEAQGIVIEKVEGRLAALRHVRDDLQRQIEKTLELGARPAVGPQGISRRAEPTPADVEYHKLQRQIVALDDLEQRAETMLTRSLGAYQAPGTIPQKLPPPIQSDVDKIRIYAARATATAPAAVEAPPPSQRHEPSPASPGPGIDSAAAGKLRRINVLEEQLRGYREIRSLDDLARVLGGPAPSGEPLPIRAGSLLQRHAPSPSVVSAYDEMKQLMGGLDFNEANLAEVKKTLRESARSARLARAAITE